MKTDHEINKRFSDKSVVRGGERYFNRENAELFMTYCIRADLAVVGIEGFDSTDSTTTPLMDIISDFSDIPATTWSEFKEKANSAARRFIDGVSRPGVWLNFTAITEDEWRRVRPSKKRRL